MDNKLLIKSLIEGGIIPSTSKGEAEKVLAKIDILAGLFSNKETKETTNTTRKVERPSKNDNALPPSSGTIPVVVNNSKETNKDIDIPEGVKENIRNYHTARIIKRLLSMKRGKVDSQGKILDESINKYIISVNNGNYTLEEAISSIVEGFMDDIIVAVEEFEKKPQGLFDSKKEDNIEIKIDDENIEREWK